MEKRRKTKFKKFIAVLCIFVILQSYFSCVAQIAIALSEELNVDNFLTSAGNSKDFVSSDNSQENKPSENKPELEPEDLEEQEEQTGIEEESGDEEEENPEEELPEDEPEENEPDEEEEPEANSEQEEEPEENPEEQETPTEEEPEEEPYVEPDITMQVSSENTSIYKGYLYANATSDLKYATNYNTIDKVTIVGSKNMTSFTIQEEPDKMQLITNTKVALNSQMYYRRSRIAVDEFNVILGKDGYINLYSPDGEEIGCINKETEVIDGEYVFTYPAQYNSVKFEFEEIKADGTISIKNDKVIKESSDFSRNQITLFAAINTIVQGSVYVGESVKSYSVEGNINLEETESRMLIDVDTDTLSVEQDNEITISVTLKTDEERYDLFENPTIDLEFPSVVNDVEITGVTLLYKNGLSMDNWEVVTNALGRKVIKLRLTGSQLEYTPGAAQQGTTVVVYAVVRANRLTADTTENLRMTYTNKDTIRKTYMLEGKDSEDISLNFVGRQELIRALSVTELDVATATTIDDKTEKIQILANQEQTVIVNGTILNNYMATLNDVVLVGKIPFVGNLDGNGFDLGTNFNSVLQTPIASTGSLVDIYYSEDGNAEADSDSWTQDVTDISKYKAYKLVLRESEFKKGESVSFEYNLTIPASVGNNAVGYSAYCTSYKIDNQEYKDLCTVGMFTEIKEIEIEDIEEDNKESLPKITVGTQVSQGGRILKDGDSVFERQVLKYSIVVTNPTEQELTNVVIRANAQNANLYTWIVEDLATSPSGQVKIRSEITDGSKEYEEFRIESFLPGESRTFEYQVVIQENVQEVYGNILVKSDQMEEQIIKTFSNSVLEAEVELRLERGSSQSVEDRDNLRNNIYKYRLYIKNLCEYDLNNIKLYLNMPSEMKVNLKDITYNTKNGFAFGKANGINVIEGENNAILFEIDNLSIDEKISISFNSTVSKFDVNAYFITVNLNSILETKNNKYNSNEIIEKFYQEKTKIDYSWTSDQTKPVLEDGDIVNFELNIKNTGFNPLNYLTISSVFPKGLIINSAVYSNGEVKNAEITQNNDYHYQIKFDTTIKENSSLILNINATYNEKLTKTDQNILEINAKVESIQLDNDILTNTIYYGIIPPYTSKKTVDIPIEQPEEPSYDEPDDHNHNHNEDNSNNENNENSGTQQPENGSSTKYEFVEAKVYDISGIVWIDGNRNGKRDLSEKGIKNQKVSLYSANSNGGIDVSKQLATTTTNKEGKYKFENIPVGSYVAILEYDSEKYNITKYQVSDAKQDENSDVISKTISINGENKLVAVTDIMVITNTGLLNVDMGLVEKNIFDLSLEKYIVKAVVKNDSGTKVYNFENGTNKKIEIHSKDYKSSIVDITYKLVVKNEGELEGYVNKIVDYLPDGLAVNLNASQGWYIGSDGGLYYNGLVGDEIKPGETREITLVTRKDLSDGESVRLVNKAEIAEYTNAYSMSDKDSIEFNKAEKEDDIGTATFSISIATGKTVQYIIIGLVIIITISIITMIIIKVKNTKKVFK